MINSDSDGDLLDSVCLLVFLRRFDDGDIELESWTLLGPRKTQQDISRRDVTTYIILLG